MREILPELADWCRTGTRSALATVIRTWRSAPRQAGAAMAVSEHGDVLGSVSGGCVEGAVYELAQQVLETGTPVLETYGVDDGDAFAVGLTCGGTVEVFVRAVDGDRAAVLAETADDVRWGRPVALATVLSGPGQGGVGLAVGAGGVRGSLGDPALDRRVALQAEGLLAQGTTGVIGVARCGQQPGDELDLLVQSFAAPPRMLVFGAVDFAAAVVRIGKFLGYRVTVCDARPVFATRRRFPDADEVVLDWPHRYLAGVEVDHRTAVCVLTHDPKFDVPLLEAALRTRAGYVGALGSRPTHDMRLRQLREAGVDEQTLSKLCSPIGLDLGARTPEETAVSIAAEIVSRTWGGTGQPLSGTELPIHR
jgi:xanthine dehydrogenase accessory factor